MAYMTTTQLTHARRNPQLLVYGAFFRGSTLSSAYLTIFLTQHGLSSGDILWLEAFFFSGFWLLWEVPSGWLADKIGHARSILWSVPFAAFGYGYYGLSDKLWEFMLAEVAIGIAQGLISGSEAALLHESLAATGQADQERYWQNKLFWYQRASYAVGSIGSLFIVHFWGVATAMTLDGILIACGLPLAWRLKDVTPTAIRATHFWRDCRQFMLSARVRATLQISSGLGLVTYFAVWLCAVYYQRAGLTIVMIGVWSFTRQFVIIGSQALLQRWAWWQRRLTSHNARTAPHHSWWWLIAAGGLASISLATALAWWLIPLGLIFDILRTLTKPRIDTELNQLISGQYRASLHSVHTALQRGLFMLVGLPIQWIDARFGFQAALFCSSGLGLALATLAVRKLQRLSV